MVKKKKKMFDMVEPLVSIISLNDLKKRRYVLDNDLNNTTLSFSIFPSLSLKMYTCTFGSYKYIVCFFAECIKNIELKNTKRSNLCRIPLSCG